jgi:hypothetical protein
MHVNRWVIMYGAIIRMYVASVLLLYLPVAVQVVEQHQGYIGMMLMVAVQVP